MFGADGKLKERLAALEKHLKQENPLLVDAVQSFRRLDRVAHRLGLLRPDQSYAGQIAWWPLISVLGPFSAGKSTFINDFLGCPLQATGAQAVDDKFTVICYTGDDTARLLPGVALDVDLRFPFYKMSEELEKVEPGQGLRVDAYLQLKTCPSQEIKGSIFIDSPGFDADAQRTATLRITDYIIQLSDLVLVLFDARRPEPGAMRDTLVHLVTKTISRPDSSKFLYVLNQLDVAGREDNPEDVVAAWQRALAQAGLTAGRFYTIFSPQAAAPIPDETVRRRFEQKRDQDLAEIHRRIRQVRVERAYRIVGALEKTAREIQDQRVPRLRELKQRWVRGVMRGDGLLFGGLAIGLLAASIWAGYWKGLRFSPPWLGDVTGSPVLLAVLAVVVIAAAFWLHVRVRRWIAGRVLKYLKKTLPPGPEFDGLYQAFLKNTALRRSAFGREPVGWGRKSRRGLDRVIADAERYVQTLNDRFADPSGPPRPPATEADLSSARED